MPECLLFFLASTKFLSKLVHKRYFPQFLRYIYNSFIRGVFCNLYAWLSHNKKLFILLKVLPNKSLFMLEPFTLLSKNIKGRQSCPLYYIQWRRAVSNRCPETVPCRHLRNIVALLGSIATNPCQSLLTVRSLCRLSSCLSKMSLTVFVPNPATVSPC